MANMRTISFDGIVIGGGGAGMRAALQLAQSGYKTAVITKVFRTRSRTVDKARCGLRIATGNSLAVRATGRQYNNLLEGRPKCFGHMRWRRLAGRPVWNKRRCHGDYKDRYPTDNRVLSQNRSRWF